MPPPDFLNFEPQVIRLVLVFFRVAGLMMFAPLFGSARVPRRFKTLIALMMTLPMVAGGRPLTSIPIPQSIGMMTIGLAGEIAFGLMLGMVVSIVFIGAQWAGEMVGQQIGLNISEVLDPQFGGGGSLVSDLYFMIATVAFLALGGHRQLVQGVYESIVTVPPLSSFFNAGLLELLLQYLMAATTLALRVAAPMFLTMVIVDISMGCISKTMPQMNVMSAGMAVRGMLGMVVLALGIGTFGWVISGALESQLGRFNEYVHPAPLIRTR